MTTPTDPLYSSQAFLGLLGRLGTNGANFLGLERIWTDYRGQGVRVGVWDSGIERAQLDLSTNYNPALHVSVPGVGTSDGLPIISASTIAHGTQVGGVIAADNNGVGGVGVAFDAQLTGVTIFGGGLFDINSNPANYLASLNSLRNFDVTNHSYGFSSTASQFSAGSSGRITPFRDSITFGRGGLGTINVAAAGNENVYNGEDWKHDDSVIVVAATDNAGQAASYSNYGCNILISASGTTLTTDLVGAPGSSAGDTATVNGTSFASPTIAGLASLMLSANANLGYRDVQEILALSASGSGSFNGGATTNENFAWRFNRANNWNGGGMHYSEDYGFGIANAYQAVRMAEVWSLFDTSHTVSNQISHTVLNHGLNRAIADLSTLNYDFSVDYGGANNLFIESVSLRLRLTHTWFTDLRISLTSAEGTTITLYDGSGASGSTSDGDWSFTFNITGLLGELSDGNWRVTITDAAGGDVGTLQDVDLTVRGRQQNYATNNDVYHYTDEVLTVLGMAGQAGRATVTDGNGGIDWFDSSAMTSAVNVNLADNGTGNARIWNGGVAGTVFANFASAGVFPYTNTIENAVTGDGNDVITGNASANRLYGMRGNDILNGEGGNDTLVGGDGADQINGGDGWDTASYEMARAGVVVGLAGWTNYGEAAGDTFSGVEGIWATNFVDFLGGNASSNALYGRGGNDGLWGYAGNDFLYGGDGNDALFGGLGADLLDGGDGWDTARYDEASAGVVVGLAGWTNYGEAAGDTFVGIEAIYATNFNDILGGNSSSNALYGRGGNDTLYGYDGGDFLYGGAGADTLSGGNGADLFEWSLGDGNDFITDFSTTSGDVIRLLGTGITSFAQLQGMMTQTPGQNQTQITIGSNTIYIWGVLPGQFSADDFRFT